MWRMAILRCLIALGWTIAGLSSAQVVYGHPHVWRSICLNVARDEMRAEGVEDPGAATHWPEWYRRGDVVRDRLAGLERVGYIGWLLAMCGGAVTAVGLMVVFPGVAAAQQRHAEPSAAADPAACRLSLDMLSLWRRGC
jgi:hypothetical protein